MIGSQAAALLEALNEPAMLVSRSGIVVRANRALARLLGRNITDTPLFSLLGSGAKPFALYLERCLGSGEPLVGSISLSDNGDAQKIRCQGSAVRSEEDHLVLLRLTAESEPGFAALTRTVSGLREELRRRRRSEARLAESVRERELLLRELDHRVKNNMQMLSALLSGAVREADSLEAKAALKDASLRFSAVSAVHQLLYRSDNLGSISSEALVSTLTDAITTLSSEPPLLKMVVDPMDLPIDTAVPIGLILNELLTNAMKYGCPETGAQTLLVEFVLKAGTIDLSVHDNGQGFDLSETRKRASGIGLVRGLLRQLGGSLRVERRNGSRCTVSFPEPQAASRSGS